MNILIIILLILLAMFLVVVEALLLPGITVAVIGAVASIIFASYFVYVDYGWGCAVTIFVVAIILSLLALFYAMRKKNISKIELKNNSDSSVPNVRDAVNVGDCGITTTRLAPGGTILINSNSVKARSSVGLIDQRTEIKIIGFDDNIAIVEPVQIMN